MIDMLGAWNMELSFCMFKLIMATHYPNSVKTRETIDIIVWITVWLMFATHDYSVIVGWCLHHMNIQAWLVGVWNIWLLSHGLLIFGIYDYRVTVGWCLEDITIPS